MPKRSDDVTTRLQNLRDQINRYDHAYYVLNKPLVSDFEYDKVYLELEKLEGEHPEQITPDSPTQRVPGETQTAFIKAAHRRPMLSLQNTYSIEEIQAFDERVRSFLGADGPVAYFCEPKLDGLAVELIYEHGVLVQALTRGDGHEGEVILPNIRTVRSVPLRLAQFDGRPPALFEVRGEILMFKNDFAQLNRIQEEQGLDYFANPRNAAAGSLRQLDARVTAVRPLRFFGYAPGEVIGLVPATQEEFFRLLGAFGLPNVGIAHSLAELIGKPTQTVPPLGYLCRGAEDIISYYHALQKLRHQLPFEIDGIVAKVDSFALQGELGTVARSPRWAAAAKYAPEQAETRVQKIIVQVGRTGALTPVAIMDPVRVGGVTITHATLHNQDEITRKDIRVGDTVVVQRAGDVIPEVVEVRHERRLPGSEPFVIPKECPVCHHPAVRQPDEVVSRCLNPLCPAVLRESLVHFVSRRAMNIDKIGEKTIGLLLEANLVRKFSDLYRLEKEQLLSLDRMGEKSASKILLSLEKSKHTQLPRFLFALGIRYVGEQTARTLADHFQTLPRFLQASPAELLAIPDIGPTVASAIHEALSDREFVAEIQELLKLGVTIETPPAAATEGNLPLAGTTIVITGTLPLQRSEIEEMIRSYGGKTTSAVSKKTSFVLAGTDPGSKVDKAQTLGVPILDWPTFQERLALR